MTDAAKSLGQYRVGIDFNPSNDDKVGQVKQKAAELIDLIYETANIRSSEYVVRDDADYPFQERVEATRVQNEIMRLRNRAIADVETAAMYAVKALTKPPK